MDPKRADMPAATPPPPASSPRPAQQPRPAGSQKRSHVLWLTVMAAVAALALSAAISSGRFPFFPWSKGDVFTSQQKAGLIEAFQQSALSIDALKSTDPALDELRRSLKLSAKELDTLAQRVRRGELRLAQVELWDYLQEDGDAVKISGGGLTQEVRLRKQPVTIVVPYGQNAPILVAGTQDGGGGVTLGVRSGGSSLLIPPFKVGETVVVPLR